MPEIPISQDVLALYPGTTCFYKATVVMVPSKVGNDLKMFGNPIW